MSQNQPSHENNRDSRTDTMFESLVGAHTLDPDENDRINDDPSASLQNEIIDEKGPVSEEIDEKERQEAEEELKRLANPVKYELKQLFKIAIPVIIATLARMAMFNIDTAFLGHLGTHELAGSSLASVCMFLFGSFIFAPAYSLNSLGSQAIGAGNPELAGNWLQLSMTVCTFMSIPGMALMWHVDSILSLFETEQNILHYARIFGQYSVGLVTPLVLYMAIRQYFQAMQIMAPATIVSCICVSINILLNWLYIYKFNLGFKGSPLATSTSIVCQLTIFILYAVIWKRYPWKKKTWGGWTMESYRKERLVNFFKVVLPITFGDASQRWAYQLVTLQCGKLPDRDVASAAVISNLFSLLWAVFWGFGLAVIIRVGFYIGKGNIDACHLVIRVALKSMLGLCSLIAILCVICSKQIAQIYSHDDDVVHLIDQAMPIVACTYVSGACAWCGNAVLEGLSLNKLRSIFAVILAWIVYFPLASWFGIYSSWRNSNPFGLSPVGIIWTANCITNCILAIFVWMAVWRVDWHAQAIAAQMRSEAAITAKKEIKDEYKRVSMDLENQCCESSKECDGSCKFLKKGKKMYFE